MNKFKCSACGKELPAIVGYERAAWRHCPCGHVAVSIKSRLESLRRELRAERISYGELVELQSLVPHIEPGDLELLEAAGVDADVVREYDTGCE